MRQYDRGDDFFGWFLGERMTYTSAYFEQPAWSIEQAQDRSIEHVLHKLQLAPGERVLDVGCGWGTLALRAAQHSGVDVTGVTLSENQARAANARIAAAGLSRRCRVVCQDYRDIATSKFDKIVCLEMVEHVGARNLAGFYAKLRELLSDRGLFVLQWTGQRRRPKSEDLIFGLFMEMHIAPGADAGLCPSAMLRHLEDASFHVENVENMSAHYVSTIERWCESWTQNRAAVVARHGEREFRIWYLFLAWASVLLEQGGAACLQVLLRASPAVKGK